MIVDPRDGSPALTVALTEYEALRAEIQERISHQITIAAANVALAAAIISFSGHFAGQKASLILALTLPFAVIAWFYFEQDLFITQAAGYIERTLKPIVNDLAAAPSGVKDERLLLDWENHQLFAERTPHRHRWIMLMMAFRYTLTAGPGVAMFGWGAWRFAKTVERMSVIEIVLSSLLGAIALASVVTLVALVRSIIRRYEDIAEDEPAPTEG